MTLKHTRSSILFRRHADAASEDRNKPKARVRLSAERKATLSRFQHQMGVSFKDRQLLNLALVHRSYANERSDFTGSNERLEFLGDSVLGVVIASHLYETFPDYPEGELARIKSFVVSEESLFAIARSLQIDTYILIGKGEECSGGRTKKALLADAMEALLGAYFLDAGLRAVRNCILRLFEPEIEKVLQNRHRVDYKTLLQHYTQQTLKTYPHYVLVRKTGPSHANRFWIEVIVNDRKYGPGQGDNKKEAERQAARIAYCTIIGE